jgi:CMD domain protein
VDALAGLPPEMPLQALRAAQADVLRYAQGSYLALLEPADPAGVSRVERDLIALRVAVLTASDVLAAHHRGRLRRLGVPPEHIAAVEHVPTTGGLPARETAILRHVDRLTQEPRAAGESDIQALQAAGLGARDIVTIAQLIAFLSFQVRVLAGLRVLAEA